MQAFIRRSEDLDISDIVDLSELRQAVLSDTISDQQQRTIELVRPVIVCLAVAYAMEDMGVNIDNAGIWMERRVAADGIREKNLLVPIEAMLEFNGVKDIQLRFRNTILTTLDSGSGTTKNLA